LAPTAHDNALRGAASQFNNASCNLQNRMGDEVVRWYSRWVSALMASFFLSACASAPPGTLLNPRCENAIWRPAPGYYPPSVCQDSSCPAICEARRQVISLSAENALRTAIITGAGTGPAPAPDLRGNLANWQTAPGFVCHSNQFGTTICH